MLSWLRSKIAQAGIGSMKRIALRPKDTVRHEGREERAHEPSAVQQGSSDYKSWLGGKAHRLELARLVPWLVVILVGLAAFALRAVHLDRSWDIFIDEITYLRISQGVAENLQVRLYGEPFYLHPPTFFFLEAIYIKLFAPVGSLIEQIYEVRYLNATLAGFSAILLLAIGRRLAGWPAGIAAAVMYAIDPFVIQADSRIMLETSAVLWVLLGYYVVLFVVDEERTTLPLWRVIFAGVLFGLALLTKDMTAFLTLLPLAVCFLLNWSIPRWQSALCGTTAALVYALYPLSVYVNDDWPQFAYQKLRGVYRLSGLVQETGFNQEGGPSFLKAVVSNLDKFATTYALLGTGAVAICVLFLLGGAARRLLVAWTASAYALLSYGIVFGTIEEQFFYYLVVPSLLATAVAATLTLRAGVMTIYRERRTLLRATVILGLVYVGWCGAVWVQVHFTPNNGYERVVDYLDGNVPKGARIASMTDTSDFLLDGYVAGKWDSVEELRAFDVEYALVDSYLVQEGYGRASPEVYRWIVENGELVYGFQGHGSGVLGLYRLPDRSATGDPTEVEVAPETAEPEAVAPGGSTDGSRETE